MNKLAVITAFRDLKKSRTRAILGIFGIMISIALLTAVSLLTDSVSVAFVDFITTDSGNRDVDISINYLPDQPTRSSYFEFKAIVDEIKEKYAEFEKYIPRVETSAIIQRLESGEWVSYSVPVVGMNFTYEEEIKFGSFIGTSYDFTQGVPIRQVIVPPGFQEFFRIEEGENITLTRNGKTINLTIAAIADSKLKFEGVVLGNAVNEFGIAMSFETFVAWQGLEYEGKVNHLLLTFKNPGDYYDVRNVAGSVDKALTITEDLQEELGWGYKIWMPKLYYLQFSEFMSAGLAVVFVFISIIAMLIAGILINGILSTSVEERIREFGIFRTLGARKSFNVKLIIYQGLLLCISGTTAGVVGASIAVKYVVIPVAEFYVGEYLSSGIPFIISPTSIILSYAIGISVSLAVSLSPAIKVARLKIVEAINPYRHEETLYKIMRESRVNVKLILVGVILAVNGAFIFFVIPQLLVSMDMVLFAGVLIFVLTVFLIGLTFIGLGLIPVLQRFLVAVFGSFFRKVINIVRITIHRYQRRNTTTVLMFSVSFAFIMFTTSIISDLQQNIGTMQRFNTGSQICVYTMERQGTKIPTIDFQEQLMKIPGIEKTSVVLAQPDTLSTIYQEAEKDYSMQISDYINFQSSRCTIYPIDEYYADTVFTQYIEFAQGSMAESFPEVFIAGEENCIISKAVADNLAVQVGDKVRLTFNRGAEELPVAFNVVGIAGKMPGCPRFKANVMSSMVGGAGVMISHANYQKYMDLATPTWVEKIFVKVQEGQEGNVNQIQEQIQELYGKKYNIYVRNVEQQIAAQAGTFTTVSTIFELILTMTVLICLFGLLASVYSTILERRREIAVIRTLGLRTIGVSTLFSIEAVITFLSSAFAGTIVGYITGYLLSGTMNLFTESPQVLAFPLATFLRIFLISITFLLVGMWFLLRRVNKQNIIQIYRETL